MILKKTLPSAFFLLSIGVLLAACGKSLSFSESDPNKMEVVIRTSADVNPDDQGRASPIVVLLYELKTPSNFDVADFAGLYKNDDQLLGGDLVHREKFHLPVSGQVVYKAELSSDTR
ncbi:MAG: type VI secretion system lipoprotein TssJ, partial [Gammaproteobacteria bacterium]|nr:type VI secretion system lipoprotein TssJ [Gammaproteobacteria bacterium]